MYISAINGIIKVLDFPIKEVNMNPSFSHIKMVAIDCDETLVRSDNTVSDYTVDVLQRLHKKGLPSL